MFTSTFTFARPAFDDKFQALDAVIAEVLGHCGHGGLDHPRAGRAPQHGSPLDPHA